MRHIKIYEEYSDDDLKGLIGDLESIGHKHKLIQGKDFGFGPDLEGRNDGKSILFLTESAVGEMKRIGFITSTLNFNLATWPEYIKDSFTDHEQLLSPSIYKSENLISKDYPFRIGWTEPKGPINNLYMVGLTSRRTGRNFPLFSYDSRNMFISPKKVSKSYEIIISKIEDLNI